MKDFNHKQFSVFLLITFSVVFAGSKISPPSEFVGHWEGYGNEIVLWSEQDSIFFSIQILPDGAVSGTVGDAKLINGYIRRNGLIERYFGNPEYLIGGDLDGFIVESEKLYRDGLHYLIIDYIDGKLVGGFHTTGSHGNPFGNNKSWKKKMKMTGTDVKLVKVK